MPEKKKRTTTTKKTTRRKKAITVSVANRTANEDIEKNRVLAVTCYLWFFCVVPLVTRKDSPYIQFHAKQGCVLALAWLALWFVGIVPLLGWLIFFFGSLALLVINLLAMLKAWIGEEWKIPYLHDFVETLNL